jgi:tetratricopeptide (TPR) repeat protein
MRFFCRLFVLFSLLIGAAGNLLFASDVVDEATKAFMDNRPKEAIPLLEAALQERPNNDDLYLFLGIAHEQLEEWEAAAETYRQGLGVTDDRATFLFNLGNSYARLGEGEKALEAYNEVISSGGSIAAVYLNRANLRVRQGEYSSAIADYRIYLSRKPDTPQKERIEKMIALLSDKIRATETARREEEKRKAEEERRRQELLDQVLSSLEDSSEETTNLSAGTGEVKTYEEDFDIVE